MFDGCHTKSLTEIVRNEGRLTAGLRQLPFVERKYDEITEVKITGFEYSHYLHADSRFTMEWDVSCIQDTAKQALQSIDTYL